jgi:hypothetical protein
VHVLHRAEYVHPRDNQSAITGHRSINRDRALEEGCHLADPVDSDSRTIAGAQHAITGRSMAVNPCAMPRGSVPCNTCAVGCLCKAENTESFGMAEYTHLLVEVKGIGTRKKSSGGGKAVLA